MQVCVLGLTSMLRAPELPAEVSGSLPQVMSGIMRLMIDLKQQQEEEEKRAAEDSEEEESEEEEKKEGGLDEDQDDDGDDDDNVDVRLNGCAASLSVFAARETILTV